MDMDNGPANAGLVIYPISYAGKNLLYASNYCLRPIVAGAALLDSGLRNDYERKGYLFDDGDPDSLSKYNQHWGELTAIQWILKHAEADVVGHAHYRRRWLEAHLDALPSGVLFVPPRVEIPNGMNLGQQFEWVNYQSRDFVGKFNSLASKNRLPMRVDHAKEMWEVDFIHPCLMALGPLESYREFMGVLIENLMPFWIEYGDEIRGIKGYPARVMAFLAERVMTGLLINKNYYFGDMRIAYGGMTLAPVA